MRLIDADVAEKIIRDYADEVGCNRGEYELANGILKAVCKLEDVPTVEAVPVVHGEWVKNKQNPEAMKKFHEMGIGKGMGVNSIYWTCSECGSWGNSNK